MVLVEAKPALATTNVFKEGDVKCKAVKVDSSSSTSSPPKPLLIYTPIVVGEYPVILFCHGFYLRNYFYSDLLNLIASHGYIVVAPQFYEWVPPMGICEVKLAGKVADWIADKLKTVLPENVKPNLDQFVMAGHSRGGKVAFSVALGYAQLQTNLKISALVGIDPVAGTGKCMLSRTTPHILKGYAGAFHLTMPVIIIGSGLGPQKAHCCAIPCAPDGVNYKQFFYESNPPCACFVTKDYGHMDMLNDNLEGMVGEMSNCMCVNGTGPRDYMRMTVSGLVVAFLRAYLNANAQDLDAIVANPDLAPTTLDPVEYVTA